MRLSLCTLLLFHRKKFDMPDLFSNPLKRFAKAPARIIESLAIALVLNSVFIAPLVPLSSQAATAPSSYFLVSPYVQMGPFEKGDGASIMWISRDPDLSKLACSYKESAAKAWQPSAPIQKRKVNGHPDMYILSAQLSNLIQGAKIDYKISKGESVLFQSALNTAPKPGEPVHFAVMGDCGKGSDGQARIASRLKASRVPLLIIPGDIVYPIGTIKYYLNNFFPYFNNEGGKVNGIKMMDSTIFLGCAGNHDTAVGGSKDARFLDTDPDSMSYFVLFDQPLNGPIKQVGPNTPQVQGSKTNIDAFLSAAAGRYPQMANFFFDYGDAHFLVLDANKYMDWTDIQLRDWVENNLKQTTKKWKIVVFHQPGFNSDLYHREEQRMRHLADLFERCGVDICFSGHSHSYQRSMPLKFAASKVDENDREAQLGFVMGKFKLDKSFDGDKKTKPDGVVYIVSGAGGAPLTKSELETDQTQWLPFTRKFVCTKYSFTDCQIQGNTLKLQQIADDGSIVDQITITKD